MVKYGNFLASIGTNWYVCSDNHAFIDYLTKNERKQTATYPFAPKILDGITIKILVRDIDRLFAYFKGVNFRCQQVGYTRRTHTAAYLPQWWVLRLVVFHTRTCDVMDFF